VPVPQRARKSRRLPGPVRVPGSAVVVATVIALAAAAVLIVLPAATATPRATPADLERLGSQISQIDEQLNQAKIEISRLDRQLADAQSIARAQHAQLAGIQRRIAVQAAAEYKGVGVGTVAALLAGEDTATLVQKAETLNLLARHDGDLLAAAAAQQQIYRSAVQQVQQAKAAQAREVAAVAKRKSQIERKLNQLERIRSQIGDPRSVPLPADLPSPTGAASIAVHTALAQLGKPYRWGGDGPDSFDCSGLTMYAWGAAGVSLPHSAAAQYDMLPHVSQRELQPGDLVFFGSPIHHVGLYIGKGLMVAAPSSGRVVQVQNAIRSSYVGAARP
jgi:cell wall-associated NlpC family hydrolase